MVAQSHFLSFSGEGGGTITFFIWGLYVLYDPVDTKRDCCEFSAIKMQVGFQPKPWQVSVVINASHHRKRCGGHYVGQMFALSMHFL